MPSIPIHPSPVSHGNGIVPVIFPDVLTTPSGLAILEIQGDIRTTAQTAGSNNMPTAIGRLEFPHYDPTKGADDVAWQKRVYLYVGKHQRLTGEVKKLPNPVAILRRRVYGDGSEDQREELEIAEIISHKLLFAHRPEPVGGGEDG